MKIWFNRDKVNLNDFNNAEKFLLIPFFDKSIVKSNRDFKNADNWIEYISQIVKETTKEDADIFVYQDKLDSNISELIQLANESNKKIIAFYNDDNSASTALPHAVDLYRTSLYKSKQKINEFALPAWSEDFGIPERLTIRSKVNNPVVGFCGAYTHPIRKIAISQLKQNININTSFNIRNNFWGGSIHNQQIRGEYIDNINECDLVLCCRGAGNFSYRLYEAMSLGRIPIIVNTDIVLPCDDIIDWSSISIWVNDVDDINTAIDKFWCNTTNDQYIALQYKIRQVYEQYISPAGFTRYLSLKYRL